PELPLELSGCRIERSNGAIGIVALEGAMPPTGKRDAGLVFSFILEIVSTDFAGGDVKESGNRAIRRTEPVRCSMQARIHQCAFGARLHIWNDNRTPSAIQSLGPGLLRIGLAIHKLAGLAVQQVVERVPVGHRYQPPAAPLNIRVKQYRNLGGVPI